MNMKMMPTTAATIFLVLPFYLTTFLLLPRSSLSFSHHRQCRQQKHQPQRLQLQHPSTSSTAASRLFSLHSSSSQRLHRLYAVTTGATESEKAGGRRSFFVQSFVRTMKKVAISSTVSSIVVGGVGGGMINVANAALPSVTVTEFETILKDSSRSVKTLEFYGAKSETGIVTLVDGTTFGISDLYESSTDPRSPLRLAATCRLYNVPTKNVGMSNALTELTNPGSRKKKVYMNDNVRSAEVKNKEKALRMEEDERLRQEEIIAQAAE